LKVFTEAGSVYEIDEHGICRKYRDGKLVDSFKALSIRSVPNTVTKMDDVYELPDGELKIGDRLYISGINNWWLSTKIARIEY